MAASVLVSWDVCRRALEWVGKREEVEGSDDFLGRVDRFVGSCVSVERGLEEDYFVDVVR